MLNESSFYQRQVILSEVGQEGQDKLKNSHVLVIGAGGLGSPLLEYLAVAGIGNITIMDFDTVSETNLHRQILFTEKDIGNSKAHCAKAKLESMNPLINITSKDTPFCETTDIKLFDIVVDCTDNFKSKFLAHDKCFKEKKTILIASIHKFEGQLQFFNYSNYSNDSACLRCLWPIEPSKSCVQNCEQAGVIGAVPGIIGTIQSLEVIKYLLGLAHLKSGETLLINLLEFSQMRIKAQKTMNCPLCSDSPSRLESFDDKFEINLTELKNKEYFIISFSGDDRNFRANLHSNLENIENDVKKEDKDSYIAITCKRGITSLKAVKKLRSLGYKNSYSITKKITIK